MKLLLVLCALVFLLAVAIAAYVRLAPSDPGRWHADPLAAPQREQGAWLVRPEGGDAAGPLLAVPPAEALAAFDALARAEPRTRVLAGSVAEGEITYVQRSRLWGFPDYISVRAVAAGNGYSRLAIWSRLRFGQGDMGVNRARVEDWLSRLDLPRAS